MKCEKYATYALFSKSFHRFFGGYPERIVKVKLIYDASQKCTVKKKAVKMGGGGSLVKLKSPLGQNLGGPEYL